MHQPQLPSDLMDFIADVMLPHEAFAELMLDTVQGPRRPDGKEVCFQAEKTAIVLDALNSFMRLRLEDFAEQVEAKVGKFIIREYPGTVFLSSSIASLNLDSSRMGHDGESTQKPAKAPHSA